MTTETVLALIFTNKIYKAAGIFGTLIQFYCNLNNQLYTQNLMDTCNYYNCIILHPFVGGYPALEPLQLHFRF